MNILNVIKTIFRKKNTNNDIENQLDETHPPLEHVYNHKHYIENTLREISSQIPWLEELYGKDFHAFFYASDMDKTIRTVFVQSLTGMGRNLQFLNNKNWEDRHPFNFPGTFYSGESDNCGTGDGEAPFNVLYDDSGCEYIFKQPQNYIELVGVIGAAALDTFASYSCNGNELWTYSECKNWWRNKAALIYELNKAELREVNGGREKMYLDYLNSAAESDLRKYCYFLEHQHYPGDETITLPDL